MGDILGTNSSRIAASPINANTINAQMGWTDAQMGWSNGQSSLDNLADQANNRRVPTNSAQPPQ